MALVCLCHQREPCVRLVDIVLGVAQIPAGDGQGAVVVDFHNDRGWDAAFPGVVAKGFSQGMAGRLEPQRFGGGADDAVRLGAGDGFAGVLVARADACAKRYAPV